MLQDAINTLQELIDNSKDLYSISVLKDKRIEVAYLVLPAAKITRVYFTTADEITEWLESR